VSCSGDESSRGTHEGAARGRRPEKAQARPASFGGEVRGSRRGSHRPNGARREVFRTSAGACGVRGARLPAALSADVMIFE